LLRDKPSHERWAVLVNEFGEVGIDGAMFSGETQNDLFIKEVPGGCMCCTSGLPMQIALNVLLAKARPHCLFIEPTGLGHPKEVLATLSAEHYKTVLDIRTTMTLVDARKVSDKRYSEHATFQEQLQIADLIYVSKADLCSSEDIANLNRYLKRLNLSEKKLIVGDQHADIDLLSGASSYVMPEQSHHHHATELDNSGLDKHLQTHGWASVSNRGEGFISQGWVFSPEHVFDYQTLIGLLSYLDVERLKAVMITERGVFVFNFADGVLSQQEIDEANDSRLEFIASDEQSAEKLAKQLEQKLLAEMSSLSVNNC
jgi:G3E family GTPase